MHNQITSNLLQLFMQKIKRKIMKKKSKFSTYTFFYTLHFGFSSKTYSRKNCNRSLKTTRKCNSNCFKCKKSYINSWLGIWVGLLNIKKSNWKFINLKKCCKNACYYNPRKRYHWYQWKMVIYFLKKYESYVVEICIFYTNFNFPGCS